VAKDAGESSVFFTDKDGKQIVGLDVDLDRDLDGLADLLAQLIPSSHIKVQSVGDRVVLTGSVINPIDASRACEVVTSFLGPLDQQLGGGSSATGGGSAMTSNFGNNNDNGGSDIKTSCLGTNVINMLNVDGKAGPAQSLRRRDGPQYRQAVRYRSWNAGEFRQFRLCRAEPFAVSHQLARRVGSSRRSSRTKLSLRMQG
jgi:hypothetical protein